MSEIAVKYEPAAADQFIQFPVKNKSQDNSAFEKLFAEKEAAADQNRKTDSLKKNDKISSKESDLNKDKKNVTSGETGKEGKTGAEGKEIKAADGDSGKTAAAKTREIENTEKKPVKKAGDKENHKVTEKKTTGSDYAGGGIAAGGNTAGSIAESPVPQNSINSNKDVLSENTGNNDEKPEAAASISEISKKVSGKAEFLSSLGIKPESTTEMIARNIKGNAAAKEEKTEGKNSRISKKDKKELFDVLDLRKGIKEKSAAEKSQAGIQKDDSGADKKISENSDSSIRNLQDGSIKDLSQSAVKINDGSSSAKGFPSFQNQLLESLRESGNTDIVKNAKLILKDNNSGEIKLLMKPEHLGYVRIKLTVEDNNIAGKIIVDNINVKELFEGNIDNLIKSFKDSGYSSAMLDVSVGGGNEGKTPSENDRALARKEFEKIEEHTVRRPGILEERLIDMVV